MGSELTLKAVILFQSFDVAHIHQHCRATRIATGPHAFRPVLSEVHGSESLSNADLPIIT